jgi:hypothetical protein
LFLGFRRFGRLCVGFVDLSLLSSQVELPAVSLSSSSWSDEAFFAPLLLLWRELCGCLRGTLADLLLPTLADRFSRCGRGPFVEKSAAVRLASWQGWPTLMVQLSV